MKFNVFNIMLRELFKQLLDEGFNKNAICSSTLGTQSTPLFERLLEGKDIGNKPLERLVEHFGYDLLIVPIKSNDEIQKSEVEQKCLEFARITKTDLTNYLENRIVKRGNKKNIEAQEKIESVVDDIFSQIGI